KGIVHRDLKPSNILVEEHDGRPLVKIIDFGIAKAVGPDNTDKTQVTRLGQLIGTPQYMSPEQAALSELDVDTRTDIYSLGVVLYELLAGVLPLDLDKVADYALGVALRERDPLTPSQRVAQFDATDTQITRSRNTDLRSLRKTLQGDLDWIVMKAIAKDRTRRYQTAIELAADLERFAQQLPVLARPPSTRYLVGRFIHRNKIAVAAVAVTTVALVAGLAVATIGLVRARAAEQQARTDAETARQVSTFLIDLFKVSDPGEARGNSVTVRAILDKAAARLKNELTAEPTVRASMLATIAQVYGQLGLYSEALPLAQTALDVRRKIAPQKTEFADSLDQVGYLYTLQSRPAEAEALHARALQIREKAKQPDNAAISLTLQRIAEARYTESKTDAALQEFLEARRLLDTVPKASPEQRAELLTAIGIIFDEKGQYNDAISSYREALSLYRRALGDDHPNVALTLSDLAIALKDTGQFAEAERTYLEALNSHRKTLGPNSPMVANTLNNLAVMYLDIGRYEDALKSAQNATEIWRVTLGGEHRQTITSRLNAALAHIQLEHYVIAERELREILTMGRRTLGPNHLVVAATLNALADVLNRQKRFREAESIATEGRNAIGNNFGTAHWRYAAYNGTLGAAMTGQGRYAEAESILLNSYAQLCKTRGQSNRTTLLSLQHVIDLYDAWGKPRQAAEYRAKLLAATKEKSSPT
ncbi:MAG TPA: serine/threonine-protein kinase, partial [Steroidobacteraceae bacterium]|nr:serine/threonine-protein kinase [Steroidobacteraceae bacterium]